MKTSNKPAEGSRRQLDHMPFDKACDGAGNQLCHATGWEEVWCGEWWNEYEDAEGNTYLGR